MELYMDRIEFNWEMEDERWKMEDIGNLSCFVIFLKNRQDSTFNIDDSDFLSSSIYFFTIYKIATNIPSHKLEIIYLLFSHLATIILSSTHTIQSLPAKKQASLLIYIPKNPNNKHIFITIRKTPQTLPIENIQSKLSIPPNQITNYS